MISLAIANLLHNRVRTGVGTAGVGFAVVLIFMQLGFLGALMTTATVVYDALNFDFCIRSKDYLHLAEARSFPRARLAQVASLPGVERVVPFYVGISAWRNPSHSDAAGRRQGILTMGVPRNTEAFRVGAIQEQVDRLLALPTDLLIDRQTQSDFGPLDGRRFSERDVAAAVETQVGEQPARLVGVFNLGTGFAANGAVIFNEPGFLRVSRTLERQHVNLGLVQLAPGADRQRVAELLAASLPEDVDLLSADQVRRAEVDYWVWDTSYGLLFLVGVALAVVVGAGIVYQVLSSDVASLLREYATLKAIGYHAVYLAGVVITQALALAAAGFTLGFVLSLLLYRFTSAQAGIPIQMTWTNAALVLLLTVIMCIVSGLAALRRLAAADPADLF